MKLICIGRNYTEHIKELENEKPTDPVVFLKPDTAIYGAAVIGDWIPVNKIEDVNNINFSLYKNNHIVQQGNTSHMLWKIDELIEYVSKYFTLKIGDIIFTGTPAGVSKVITNDKLKGFIENTQMFSITVK